MNKTDLIYETLLSNNLIELTDRFEALLNSQSDDRSQRAVLRDMKVHLQQAYCQLLRNKNYENPKAPYCIFSEHESVILYFIQEWEWNVHWSKQIISARDFIQKTRDTMLPPEGAKISEQRINEILAYLNDYYHYLDAITPGYPLNILLLDHTHNEWNSYISHMLSSDGTSKYQITLTNMHFDAMTSFTPESIFLHELGHMIHTEITGSIEKVPGWFAAYVEMIEANIAEDARIKHTEVFAEFFAMAMTHNSPLSVYGNKHCFPDETVQFIKKLMVGTIGRLHHDRSIGLNTDAFLLSKPR